MAKPRRMSAARQARRPWWVFVAIVVLIIVDVLLVILALQSTAPRPQGASAASSSEFPTPVESAPSTPSPEESGASAESITAAPPTRLITALDADTAWRATTGGCPDAPAAPELTTDGGASWKTTDITGVTDVRALQRIVVAGPETASFIGATGSDCAPQYVRTFVAGDDFAEYPELLDDSWFVTPVGSATVHSPDGEMAAPCERALVVAPLDAARAAVLCADSAVHVTTDTGSSWTALDGTEGAVAVTNGEEGVIVALAGTPECAGAQLALFDAAGSRTDIGCVESPLDASELVGSTAIDWNADALWVWIDDRLLISTDGGTTW